MTYGTWSLARWRRVLCDGGEDDTYSADMEICEAVISAGHACPAAVFTVMTLHVAPRDDGGWTYGDVLAVARACVDYFNSYADLGTQYVKENLPGAYTDPVLDLGEHDFERAGHNQVAYAIKDRSRDLWIDCGADPGDTPSDVEAGCGQLHAFDREAVDAIR